MQLSILLLTHGPVVDGNIFNIFRLVGWVICVYLLSLPVAHLSDAPRGQLVVTGNSAKIQDETTERSAWVFTVLGV